MDIEPEYGTFYTIQYQQAFLKYVENKYCAKHRHVPLIKPESVPSNNHFPSAMAAQSGQTSIYPYDLSSNKDEDLMANNVAAMTP